MKLKIVQSIKNLPYMTTCAWELIVISKFVISTTSLWTGGLFYNSNEIDSELLKMITNIMNFRRNILSLKIYFEELKTLNIEQVPKYSSIVQVFGKVCSLNLNICILDLGKAYAKKKVSTHFKLP